MIKYADIILHTTIRNGAGDNEFLYFTVDDELFYEWRRNSRTINVKARINPSSDELAQFGMYPTTKPTMRAAKSCILTYIKENEK